MYRRNVGLSRADSVWVGAGQGCDWGPDMIEKIETMVSGHLRPSKGRVLFCFGIMVTSIDEWNIFWLSLRYVQPSVDGVKAVSEGGVGRLQLVDLLLAVPDLRT